MHRTTPNPARIVSAEALAAWRAKDRWGLYRALRLRPWDANPLDANSELPRFQPGAWVGLGGCISHPFATKTRWDEARAWRVALEKADRNAY